MTTAKTIKLTVIAHNLDKGDVIKINEEYTEYVVTNATATEVYLKRLNWAHTALRIIGKKIKAWVVYLYKSLTS